MESKPIQKAVRPMRITLSPASRGGRLSGWRDPRLLSFACGVAAAFAVDFVIGLVAQVDKPDARQADLAEGSGQRAPTAVPRVIQPTSTAAAERIEPVAMEPVTRPPVQAGLRDRERDRERERALEARLSRSLARRGLEGDDLRSIAGGEEITAGLAKARAKGDQREVEARLTRLVDLVDETRISRELLRAKLARVQSKLAAVKGTLTPDRFDVVESHYLDLAQRTESVSENELGPLAVSITKLAGDVRALEKSGEAN